MNALVVLGQVVWIVLSLFLSCLIMSVGFIGLDNPSNTPRIVSTACGVCFFIMSIAYLLHLDGVY